MPGYSSSATGASENECPTVGASENECPTVGASGNECPTVFVSSNYSNKDSGLYDCDPFLALSSRSSANVEDCEQNLSQILDEMYSEYLVPGFISAFPDFYVQDFSQPETCYSKLGELIHKLEEFEPNIQIVRNVSLEAKYHSFLCMAYVSDNKIGNAENEKKKIDTLWKDTDLGETRAWMHIAMALYYRTLPAAYRKGMNYLKFAKEHIEQARVNFQHTYNFQKRCQMEKAMCIWWQIYLQVSVENYHEKRLIHNLAGSETPVNWHIHVDELTEKELQKYLVFILTFNDEISQTEGLASSFMETVKENVLNVKVSMEHCLTGKGQITVAKSLQECFRTVDDKMTRLNIPDFIQNYYLAEATLKIFVDINKGKEQQAGKFCEINFPDLWKINLISLVEQEEIDFAKGGKDEIAYAAQFDPNLVSFAKLKIQRASPIIALDPITHAFMTKDAQMKQLEHVTRKYKSSPCGSIGCFMEDKDDNMYAVTARHPLISSYKDGKPKPTNGFNRNYNFPVCTEITDNEQGQIQTVGNICYSGFSYLELENKQRKAVDIAAVRVNRNVLDSPYITLGYRNHLEKSKSLHPYKGCDADILGTKVQKTGPVTNTTFGEVLSTKRKVVINNRKCDGIFAVACNFSNKSDAFALKGDSGSLVISDTTHTNMNTATAYGLIYSIQRNYHDAEFNQTRTVTWCTRLDNGLEFLRQYFGLVLAFPDEQTKPKSRKESIPEVSDLVEQRKTTDSGFCSYTTSASNKSSQKDTFMETNTVNSTSNSTNHVDNININDSPHHTDTSPKEHTRNGVEKNSNDENVSKENGAHKPPQRETNGICLRRDNIQRSSHQKRCIIQ